MGGITQPIWNNRAIKTQYEISQSEQKIALLNLEKELLSAGKEVSNAMVSVSQQKTIIGYQEAECAAYREAVIHANDLLLFGSANYLEVITARQNLLSAELNLVNNELSKIVEYLKLYHALGGGWQ